MKAQQVIPKDLPTTVRGACNRKSIGSALKAISAYSQRETSSHSVKGKDPSVCQLDSSSITFTRSSTSSSSCIGKKEREGDLQINNILEAHSVSLFPWALIRLLSHDCSLNVLNLHACVLFL